LPEATYVLASQYPPGWEEPEEVSLADYILVLWRRRRLIVVGTVICTLAAFVISHLLPKVYEAKSTLILQPSAFTTELKPNPLSVETYQPIAESGQVLQTTRERLVAEGNLPDKDSSWQSNTVIHPSKIAGQGYQPILELVVRFRDPQQAAMIANVWAETVIQESTGLANEGKKGTLEFIQTEYPSTKERLESFERNLKKTQDRFDRDLKNKKEYWESRIAEFKTEWNLAYMRRELEALQSQLTADVVQLNNLEAQIQQTGNRLDNLKSEIKGHTQFIVVSKSITDDALWDQVANEASRDQASQLQELKLQTQVPNPVYQNLQQKISDTQVLHATLIPQQEHLEKKVSAQRKQVRDLNLLILQKELALQKLMGERDTQMTLLERERDYQVAGLTREVESSHQTFELLSQAYENARLAQTESEQDIRIGALAVVPRRPVSPRPLLNTAIAFVVGLMLSTMAAFVVEYVTTSASADS
jgi:uncharacterized protein involved in exopolysaccharide biosynthesis